MAISLKVTTNASQVAKNMQSKAKNVKTASKQATRELAEFIQERAQYYAPYRTGRLERNIVIQRVGTDRFTVTARAPYSSYQELGVPATSFIGWRPIRGMGMKRVKNSPYHPGIPPRGFMRRAGQDGRREAKRIFGDKIKLSIRRI